MKDIIEISNMMRLLGDKTRLTIMGLLKDKEWCVCDLVAILNISQPAVSQHLRKLKGQGLVKETKRAQWVYYSVALNIEPYIQTVLDALPDSQTLLSVLKKDYIACSCD